MPERVDAVAEALAELDVLPGDRVLVMLPDGPGFVEALMVTTQWGAVPLPVNPLLAVQDIATVAAEADARLVLLTADRIHTLGDLGAGSLVLVDGPQGIWAVVLRLR